MIDDRAFILSGKLEYLAHLIQAFIPGDQLLSFGSVAGNTFSDPLKTAGGKPAVDFLHGGFDRPGALPPTET